MPYAIKNKILLAAALFLVTVTVGVIGYMAVAPGSTALNALYMTVITLTTVGYGEVIDLTGNPAGKIFTMALIMFGMGNLLFVVTTLTSFLTDGELREILRKRRMLKMIEKITVVCGRGIICGRIIQELVETGRDFVYVTESA